MVRKRSAVQTCLWAFCLRASSSNGRAVDSNSMCEGSNPSWLAFFLFLFPENHFFGHFNKLPPILGHSFVFCFGKFLQVTGCVIDLFLN